MNSFNHYAYGAIGEWLYRVVAGLEIDEAQPGYRLAVISPVTGGGLTHARGSYASVYGPVSSAWEKQGRTVTLTAEIPVNVQGLIRLESGAESPVGNTPFARDGQGRWTARVGSGRWTVSYTIH